MDLKSLKFTDIVLQLHYAGIKQESERAREYWECVAKKIIALIDESRIYCLVTFEQLLVFDSKADANSKIKSLKSNRRDKHYFDGEFVCMCDNIFLFEYKKTNRASDAVRHDFLLSIETSLTIQSPAPRIIHIDVDIICLARSSLDTIKKEGKKRGLEEGKKRALKRIAEDSTIDSETVKKLRAILNEDPVSNLSVLVDLPAPVVVTEPSAYPVHITKPNEDSQTSHR